MLKLQDFGHLMRTANSQENTLILGKTIQEERGATEDGMVGWHHQLNQHDQTLGDSEGQGSLACCSSWGTKELEQFSNQTTTTNLETAYLLCSYT